MNIIKLRGLSLLVLGILVSSQSMGHTVLCTCYENGDGTAICEGGFSDGSSAVGVKMRVETGNGKVLFKGLMDRYSEFTFKAPSQVYRVVFEAGEGHTMVIDGKEIME